MTATLVSTAEAIKDFLNGQSFSMKFDACRSYADWKATLEGEDEKLHVDVIVVRHDDVELVDKTTIAYDNAIQVAVRRKFGQSELVNKRVRIESVDQHVELLEEVNKALCGGRITGFEDAIWTKSVIEASYVPAHLKDAKQYTGLIRFTYKVDVDL